MRLGLEVGPAAAAAASERWATLRRVLARPDVRRSEVQNNYGRRAAAVEGRRRGARALPAWLEDRFTGGGRRRVEILGRVDAADRRSPGR